MLAHHWSKDNFVICSETVFLGWLARSTDDEVIQVESDVTLGEQLYSALV